MRSIIRKGQPAPGDVHVNRPLTNVSVAFTQAATQFIANRAFPVVSVPKQSDLYFIYDRANWMVGGAQKRAPSSESAGGGYTQSTDNYRCDVWALHKDVDDQVRANSDAPLRPDQDATNWITENMLIEKENEWATDFFATAKWTTETASDAWDLTGTPVDDIRTAKTAVLALTGREPNRLICSVDVWHGLMDNDQIIDRLSGGATTQNPAMGMMENIARILELEEILVAKGIQNSAQEGATESTDFILGKHALLLYTPPSPGLMIPSAGYTFVWSGLMGAGANGTRIKRFRMESLESDRIEGQSAYVHKQVSADLGAFFLNAVS